VTPAVRKPVVQYLREERGMSERRACGLVSASRMTMRYASRRDDTMLRARLRELAAHRRPWGYRKLRILLLREGMVVNHEWKDLGGSAPDMAACSTGSTPCCSRSR
jgi:putative transposase